MGQEFTFCKQQTFSFMRPKSELRLIQTEPALARASRHPDFTACDFLMFTNSFFPQLSFFRMVLTVGDHISREKNRLRCNLSV